MHVSREVARRYLLGRQGLWPGRRWHGLDGTAMAMRTMGNVQLDPLRVVARAHDLALASRVIDYAEGDWARLTHDERRFFEWGGWLAVRPMEELPYYRVLMRRARDDWWAGWILSEHPAAVEEMRRVLPARGEVSNRDFTMGERARVESYRGRKDSSVALNYLWRIGEAMVIRRTATFERVYAPAEAVAPTHLLREAGDAEADDFLLLKMVRTAGLVKIGLPGRSLGRTLDRAEVVAWRDAKVAAGVLTELTVEGLPGRYLVPAVETAALESLAAGRVPAGWQPLESTTTDEVTFLSPLDPVIHDRARTSALFDFDYKWGVYDKVEKRRYGYYDLPILWGDRLVGRADLKLDRPAATLRLLGLWYEDEALRADTSFQAALDRGFERLRAFVGATGTSR